jgi:large subunit ribosomal protein L15
MKIHELSVSKTPDQKRVGRGIGSGKGKTAGRGTKGQNSRSGGGVRPGFEGGQNPLAKRLPKKRGFRSLTQNNYATVTLTELNELKGTNVTAATLFEQGLVKSATAPVKVLGTGELKKKLSVSLQAATATAKSAIEAAGGSFTVVEAAKSPKKPSKRNRATKA